MPAKVVAEMVTAAVPDALTGLDGAEQLTSIKVLATEQVTVTLPVKLFCGVIVTLAVDELPATRATVLGLALIWKSPNHCSAMLLASMEPQPVVSIVARAALISDWAAIGTICCARLAVNGVIAINDVVEEIRARFELTNKGSG